MSANSQTPSAQPVTTPRTDTDAQPPGFLCNRNRYGRNNNRNNSSSGCTVNATQLKDFKGTETDIKSVLCMPEENVAARMHGFKQFQEDLEDLALKKFENADDVTPMLSSLKDPLLTFTQDNPEPDDYTPEECEQSEFKKKLYENSVE
jgi:hypothetical protein